MHHINVQFAASDSSAPDESLIQNWANAALTVHNKNAELTIRIVDVDEMTTLNQTYRSKTGPTNVLSFPADLHEDIADEFPILGDIVICAEVVNDEAEKQNKEQDAHWAHMVIHGVLHLLGHDHVVDADAEVMEKIEIKIMHKLGYDNPYEAGDKIDHHE